MEDLTQEYLIQEDWMAERELKTLKKAQEEKDRLLELVKKEQEELNAAKEKIESDYKWIEEQAIITLEQFMDNISEDKKHKTKTQEKYKLLSGEIIKTLPINEIKYDEEKLIANEKYKEYMEYKPKFKWGEFKKTLTIVKDKIINEDGEVLDVDGLYLEAKEPIVKIKLKGIK
ncbi:MAG TPA: hypothetical protein GX005_00150 [Bacteroidales bacterium]|nr:hypothetical protein [Bacteroidales bacterium]